MQNVGSITTHIGRNGGSTADASSKDLREKTSIMGRLNEKIEVSKSTLWLIGIAPAFLGMALQFGGSWALSIRDDQNTKNKLGMAQYQLGEQGKQNDRIESELKKMNDGYQEMREFKIKVETAQTLVHGLHK